MIDSEILRYASYICYAVAAVLFILAIVLFFTMKIKDVIYELSGKAKTVSTQRMNDSYLVTGSLRTSSTLTDSFDKGSSVSASITNTVSGGARNNGKTQESGNIRKANQSGKTKNGTAFKITKDVVIIHTNERIS